MLKAIDLFAGAGGFSTGASRAGVRVIWAANHNREAVQAHAANHPETIHSCQDLQLADWSRVPDHDILLASPCCQGHSKSKGNRNNWNHAKSRQTAWCVHECAARRRPMAIVVENVPEFQHWNESDNKSLKGSVFRTWVDLIQNIGPGYHFSAINLDAADLGVPQNRDRLFMVFVRADVASSPLELVQPSRPHVPFRKIMRSDKGPGWSYVKDKCITTRRFVDRVSGHQFPRGKRFLLPYYGGTRDNGPARSVERPLGTVTTVDRYGLVSDCHKWMRMLTLDEYRAAMGFPAGYVLDHRKTEALKQLGNAVVPDAATWVVSQVVNKITGRRSKAA
jgi:DNA (cytosine-5)-methyltransferase 1